MQTIIVDTTPGFRMPTLFYSQGDIGRTFAIDLRSRFGDSLPASPTITIQATKPSGLGFSVASTSLSGAVATFTVTETMSNEAGRFPAELKVVKSGTTLYTANFYIECEASAHPEGTTDGDLDSIMPKFMSVQTTTLPAGDSATYSFDPDTNTATFGIPKGADGSLTSQVLAADYSSSKTYAVGDYVYYNGNLYRCSTAITTAEAWTSGHWTQVALANDVTDLKSALSDEETARINADNALSVRIDSNDDDISDLQTAVVGLDSHKVSQPLDEYNQPTDGTNGQSLRTKGDGTTEWADVGLPTDEQTAQAVSDWLDDHPEATTTVQDGSLTYEKFNNSLKKYIIEVNPDHFSGTDTEKLQLAFDACINGGAIILNREYTINSDIVIKTNSDYSKYIHVYCMGDTPTINMGNHSFVGNAYPAGNVYFHNVHFKGSGTGDAFLCQSLVRIFFQSCTFENFKNCFYSGTGDQHILQTIYVINCFFRGIQEAVFKSETSTFDVRMDHCAVEWSKSVIKNVFGNGGSNQNLTVSHCAIEGMSGTCFILNQCFGCSIHNNYFESNDGYFDLQNTAGSIGLRIENNLFIDRDADKGMILLPKATNNTNTLFIVNNSLMFSSNNFVYQDTEYNSYIRGVILANNGNAQYSSDIREHVYIMNDGTDYVDNFNNCIFEGSYINGGGAKTGAPSEKYGLLTVSSRGSDGLQLYATYDNELYYRKRNGNSQYTNWKAINPAKQSFTITSVSDAIISSQRCYKKGNTVVINALIANTTALGSGEVEVASIPSDCIPSESVMFNCDVGLFGYVSSAGRVCFYHSGDTKGYAVVNVVYDI